MTRFLLPIALLLALPAEAGTKDDNTKSREDRPVASPEEIRDRRQAFIDANIAETLYHELGHALIDVMDLPVFGPEEFAVDFFAIVMINRMFDEDTVIDMTYDIAAAYDAGASYESGRKAFWDVHGTDEQRYYNLACHMYGADPEHREEIVHELRLPDERAEYCDLEYQMTARAWGAVLDQLKEGTPGNSLSVDWVIDKTHPTTRYVTGEVARLNEVIALPEPVTVSVIPCDEANAYYDPDKREILICTELGEYLGDVWDSM